MTRIPVSDSAPAEEAPAVEEPIAEEVAETVEVAEPAVEPTPVEAAEEAAAEHEEQSAPVEEAPAAPIVEEKSDIPAAGEDIFAEFEKKKQQILNFDIGEQPETERRSKFAGLKFGNDFNLMDDEDDDF